MSPSTLRHLLCLASDYQCSFPLVLEKIVEQISTILDARSGVICVSNPSSRKITHAQFSTYGSRCTTHSVIPASLLKKLENSETTNNDVYVISEEDPLLVFLLKENERTVCLVAISGYHSPLAEPKRLEHTSKQLHSFLPVIFRALLRDRLQQAGFKGDIIGVSDAFLSFERRIRLLSGDPRWPILITGDRGSGKELAAWSIHCTSDRWDQVFLPILSSTFVNELLLSELFGHEQYSFTGARRRRLGKFQAADNGTVFLDEVADLELPVQSTLLRVIDRGEVASIGKDIPTKVDVRVVSATNKDLITLSNSGSFRKDLFDRLCVLEIRVPPIRERKEDISFLFNHFLIQNCKYRSRSLVMKCESCTGDCRSRERLDCVDPALYEVLVSYRWPGNIRELQNVVTRILAAHTYEELSCNHVLEHIGQQPHRQSHTVHPLTSDPDKDLSLDEALRQHICKVLEISNFNQSRAARHLGIPLSTMRSKMKKLRIEGNVNG